MEYGFAELDELVLAYATTIHKAHGSEYPVVVIPLATQHYVMLARNLLYTGVTRDKRPRSAGRAAQGLGHGGQQRQRAPPLVQAARVAATGRPRFFKDNRHVADRCLTNMASESAEKGLRKAVGNRGISTLDRR